MVDFPKHRDPDLRRIAESILKRKLFEYGARLSVTGTAFECDGECLTPRSIADECWVENPKVPRAALQIVIDDLCRHMRRDRENRLKAQILEMPHNDGTELARFVRLIAATDTEPDRLAYYVTSFRQLIWQVKRRMRGLPTAHDIMVVLHSKQGTGKSTAVAKLGSPLAELYMGSADFTLFSDKFRIQQIYHHYLICFDEMGKASKTDINTIKQVITSPYVQSRAIYSSAENALPRNASFIATTNWPISHSIIDTSGMRRFADIHCRDEVYSDAWGSKLNSVDFEAIWGCETGELDTVAPIKSVPFEIVTKMQAELSTVSDFEYFRQLFIEQADPSLRVRNLAAYDLYAAYCQRQRRPQLSIQMFAREMREHYPIIKTGNAVIYKGIRLLADGSV